MLWRRAPKDFGCLLIDSLELVRGSSNMQFKGRLRYYSCMRAVARSLPMLLSLLLIFVPLSASACDLSCWLQRNAPDCHWIGSPAENSEGTMSDASDMDMNSGVETGTTNAQTSAGSNHAVNAGVHHSMPTQKDMRGGSLQIVRKSDASSIARFDDSNTVSPCGHGTCAQAATPSSPPREGHAQPANLQSVGAGALNPATPLTTTRLALETAPRLSLLADILPTLRI